CFWLVADAYLSAFLALLAFAFLALLARAALRASAAAKRALKRSTRPSVSIIFSSPVKNGCEALEMCTFTSGYSLPSSHLIVSLVVAVLWVRKLNPAASSLNTTGR